MTIEEIKEWVTYSKSLNQWESIEDHEIIDTLLAEVERLKDYHGCAFAGPGRGDCESHTNYKGISIPDQHDGSDDTEDVYGRPNGVCWWCWHTEQIRRLHSKLRTTEQKLAVATEALERIANIGGYTELQNIARTALERMKNDKSIPN